MGNENTIKSDGLAEELRLMYYNRYLLDNRVITEREHTRMYTNILAKHASAPKK